MKKVKRCAISTHTPTLIENPIPMKRFNLPKYHQLLYAWQFGENHTKPFCFWEYNIPKIIAPVIEKPHIEMYEYIYSKTGEKKVHQNGIINVLVKTIQKNAVKHHHLLLK